MQNNLVETFAYGGQGVVSAAVRDALGNPMGFTSVGEVDDLKIALAVSMEKLNENQTGARGIIKKRRNESGASIQSNWYSRTGDNLARVLWGGASKVAQGTVTGEVMKAYLGKTMPLAHINVSTVVVKSQDGVTTYVDGTDYTLNAEVGSINFLTGGAILDAATIQVDYAYSAQEVIEPLTTAQPEVWLRFEGLNDVESNKPVVVDCYRFATDPLKELALINAKGFGGYAVNGDLMMDLTKTSGSKYFRYRYVA